MRANLNSGVKWPLPSLWQGVVCAFLIALPAGLKAAPDPFKDLTERLYKSTKERFQAEPANDETAWRFARACFEWAEFAKGNSDRAALAEEGIAAAKSLIDRKPASAHGYYYLGMNLGQLARTRTLTALGIVSDMEERFEKARQLDKFVDYAGPDRYLGMLYRDAPGWPASIGNRKKAREHLLRAVELRLDYPENQLEVLETFREWSDKDAFLKQFGPAAVAIEEARKKLTGEYWEGRWKDWDARWHELRAFWATLDSKKTR